MCVKFLGINSRRAEEFKVPVNFLQHQAFSLYEQELEQLRSQMQQGSLSNDTIKQQEPAIEAGSVQSNNLFKRPNAVSESHAGGLIESHVNMNDVESYESSSSGSTSSVEKSSSFTGHTFLQRSRILQNHKLQDINDSDDSLSYKGKQIYANILYLLHANSI